MDPKDSHKTAFSTPHGHCKFYRMPFCLRAASATFERLDLTLTRLIGQPEKCVFLRPEVGYLGHIIDQNGVRPDPKKIIAVLRHKYLNTYFDRSFLVLS